VIVVALLLLLGETSIYQYVGESLCQVPVNTQSLWNAARKALDLNMRSPHYVVRCCACACSAIFLLPIAIQPLSRCALAFLLY